MFFIKKRKIRETILFKHLALNVLKIIKNISKNLFTSN